MAARALIAVLLLVAHAGGLVNHVRARFRALRLGARSGFDARSRQCRASGSSGTWPPTASLALVAGVPAPIARRASGPFFEGWAIRAVDAALGVVMVIIGSFRAAGEPRFTSHLLVLQHHPPGAHPLGPGSRTGGRVAQVLMGGDDVRIRSRRARTPFTAPGADGRPADFEWRILVGPAAGGSLAVDATRAWANFSLRGLGVHVAAVGRAPWNPHARRTGPEGWMRHVGALLPCRYFVHSLGSRGAVAVRIDRPPWPGPGTGAAARLNGRAELRAEHALVHVEGNYGRLFPAGWSWVHAIAPRARGSAERTSLLAVGGLFQIAALTTRTWIIAFRHSGGRAWDFRTTDGDRVREVRQSCNGSLHVDARSRDGRRRLAFAISAPRASFGAPIYVPTATGFSASPGCTEAHGATLNIRTYMRATVRPRAVERRAGATLQPVRGAARAEAGGSDGWEPAGSHTLRLATLEFGGAYTCAAGGH
ncbi:hypothetical protein KFE25_002869 [Diacronema lutheri]|uniref:Uncharacterized protein n=1 Tax=Diacronema lutheri TaxID=2081491 RepID=A0A8J6C8N9_DIALT|nr:hypothetical protein KFE25_002869 [Diacronema lutheri]